MSGECARIVRERSRVMAPRPTGVAPRTARLDGIRAVLFDVYGTLLISASGDIDAVPESRADAFIAALGALDLASPVDGQAGADRLLGHVRAEHGRLRARGIGCPEIDIREIWRSLAGELGLGLAPEDLERLAVEFEVRVNPVWPMPGARACIDALRDRGLVLGIVSNAQFYTDDALEALLGARAAALGFEPELTLWSYRLGAAKPGPELYSAARRALERRGLEPHEALYVGNDMRNDIAPARAAGMRTALFAGDARSLRLREEDPQLAAVDPNLVLIDLPAILECL